jgi:hypothetical protein
MIPFAAGVSIVFAALMGALWWLDRSIHWYDPNVVAMLMVVSIAAPTLAAWITAEAIHLGRARRLFDRRVAAGVIGVCVASVLLVIVDRQLHDVVILSGSAALGSVLVLAPLKRIRPGSCVYCGYDVRSQPPPGQPGWGICPECGAGVGAGRRACTSR